jgi:riboflavin biosynthesis pyrimidine reductase
MADFYCRTRYPSCQESIEKVTRHARLSGKTDTAYGRFARTAHIRFAAFSHTLRAPCRVHRSSLLSTRAGAQLRCACAGRGAARARTLAAGPHERALAQHLVDLLEAERTALVMVKGGEELVDVCLGCVDSEGLERVPKLMPVDGAVAVVVPLTEEVHDACAVAHEEVAQLVDDGHVRAGLQQCRSELAALAPARLLAHLAPVARDRRRPKLVVQLAKVDLARAVLVLRTMRAQRARSTTLAPQACL